MRQCNNCGEHVSEQFARVFGDNDDEVFACNNCTVLRELFDGRGSVDVSGESETTAPLAGAR